MVRQDLDLVVRILSPFCCLLLLRGAASVIYKGFVGLRSDG